MKTFSHRSFALTLLLSIISSFDITTFANVKPQTPRFLWQNEAEVWVENTLQRMTLAEKIGQLFIIDYEMSALKGNVRSTTNAVRDLNVGGFLVRKTMDPNMLMRETKRLQNMTDIPLFFAADFERGAGHNDNFLTEFPTNMALGATRNLQLAEQMGRIVAQESRVIGVNLVFAPVVDINNNPENPIINTRSFGENPYLVADMAEAFVRGAERNGLLTTLKHFPGHGNTTTDSHSNLGTIQGSRQSLDNTELLPYSQLLKSDVPPSLVMTAHLAVPALDDSYQPATFSSKILKGILRNEMNFDGIIITDGINMGAVTKNYSFEETIIRPLEAGADIVLLPDNPRRAVDAVRDALMKGRLTEERLDESMRRILRAKAKIRAHSSPDKFATTDSDRLISSGALQVDGSGREISRRIAESSITLLKNENALPLQAGQKIAVVQMTYMRLSDGLGNTMNEFTKQLKTTTSVTDCRMTARANVCNNERATRTTIMEAVGNADEVVLTLYLRPSERRGNVSLNPEQQSLADAILRSGKPVTIVTFGSPYIAEMFPKAQAIVVGYDQTTFSAVAAGKLVMGNAQATGKLPVSVGTYRFGTNLDLGALSSPMPPPAPARSWKLQTF